MNKVVVLGSLNMDLVISVDRLPQIGETLIANQLAYYSGGKGANQAVAASRVGAEVIMLGKIGKDTFGQQLFQTLEKENIQLDGVGIDETAFTGIANVFKLPDDNCITVVPGANATVDAAYVTQHAKTIQSANILLMQLETPICAIYEAIQIAKAAAVKTILNPAPYTSEIKTLLHEIDYLTPNELEFQALLPEDLQNLSFESQMLAFAAQYQTSLIVTRGENGVSFVEDGQVFTIASPKAKVVDTTGAGDTFNGILAQGLSQGKSLKVAVELATVGATLSISKVGAQTGMPSLAEVISASSLTK